MAGFLLVESEGRTACLDFPCGRLPEELPRRRGAFFVNLLGDNPATAAAPNTAMMKERRRLYPVDGEAPMPRSKCNIALPQVGHRTKVYFASPATTLSCFAAAPFACQRWCPYFADWT